MTFHPPEILNRKKTFLPRLLALFLSLFILSCSSSERFTRKEETRLSETGTAIRVLVSEWENNFTFVVKNQLIIRDENKKIALIKSGNTLRFEPDEMGVRLWVGNKDFRAEYFLLENEDNSSGPRFDGKIYTGIIKVVNAGNKISVINTLSLEDYLKGVLPSEMPVGKGEAYFESFKAFAVCARTYAVNRINEGKSLFDIYADTKDQVYGGAGRGNALSDKAVDDTRGLILTHNGKPAVIYYHSTCGGNTENAANVFSKNVAYLNGVKDGDNPYCSDSPRFTWQEVFEPDLFITRLFLAKLLPDTNFELRKIYVKSRFDSGRINELQILVADKRNNTRILSLYGNSMRSVIRTADNSTILRSNWFDVDFNGSTITLKGRGYGHGVGLCQWGAMNLSAKGSDAEKILYHYYPGTSVTKIND